MMTSRERWLAALHLQPVDRLPFSPKIDKAYLQAQSEPYQTMTVKQFHQWLGSDPLYWTPPLVHVMRGKTRIETVRDQTSAKTIYHTPLGNIASIQQYNPQTRSWGITTYPVHSHDGLAIMTEFYRDARPKLDRAVYEKAKAYCATVAQTAVTATSIGTSPFLELVQGMLDPQCAADLLTSFPSDVDALLEALHEVMLKRMEYCCGQSPTDILYLIENTAAMPLPPPIYRKYCLPHIRAYAEMAQQAHRLLVLQITGPVAGLLSDIGMLPLAGIESFITPPVGDATLDMGRAAAAKSCLIGGTNPTLWKRPMLEIIVGLDEQFEALPHLRGVVVTSGNPMPPEADAQKLKEVAAWIQAYPIK